jgi:hypothetical protein
LLFELAVTSIEFSKNVAQTCPELGECFVDSLLIGI